MFVSLGIPLCLTSDKEMMVCLTIKASLPAASVFINTVSITEIIYSTMVYLITEVFCDIFFLVNRLI